MNIVVATGGFDPLHSGHIAYLRAAKALGDYLIVGVNSNAWLEDKKSHYLLDENERIQIIAALKPVDAAVAFDDSDGTAVSLLNGLKARYPKPAHCIIFANGGDRTELNTPEQCVQGIEFVWNVGGGKSQSSSNILSDYINKCT